MGPGLFKLSWEDLGRGLLVAVLSAVLTALYEYIPNGFAGIKWEAIATVAVTAGVAYLIKNLGTGSGGQILTNKTPVQSAEAAVVAAEKTVVEEKKAAKG